MEYNYTIDCLIKAITLSFFSVNDKTFFIYEFDRNSN